MAFLFSRPSLRQGFDELLELAEKGDHRKVDMLVLTRNFGRCSLVHRGVDRSVQGARRRCSPRRYTEKRLARKNLESGEPSRDEETLVFGRQRLPRLPAEFIGTRQHGNEPGLLIVRASVQGRDESLPRWPV